MNAIVESKLRTVRGEIRELERKARELEKVRTYVQKRVGRRLTLPLQETAFHRAALDAGGADNGKPGPRPGSGASYYAAFALDPDGHNVEAVVGGVG